MKRPVSVLVVCCLLSWASICSAQVTVPNGQELLPSTAGGLNTIIRDLGAARTAQLLISPAQLTGINVGDFITGISFRMVSTNTTGFPTTAAANYTDYEIRVGQGVPMGTQTTTFATNFVGTPTLVRDGPLTIPIGAFPAGNTAPNPTPFANPTPFTFQTPHQYIGGPLLFEFRHPGSDIINPANSFLQAVTSDPNLFWSATATSMTATTGAVATYSVSQILFSPIPEPTSLALVGVGVAGLAWRRYRRK